MIESITPKELKAVQDKIYAICGIHIDDSKASMMKNRIYKLAKEVAHDNIGELLQKVDKDESVKECFVNVFTTNKTDFFRESFHFDDMLDRALPELFRNQPKIKIYCCASSSGQEPYTIALTALYAKQVYNSSADIEIVATDIDTQMLELAKKGVYEVNPQLEKYPKWVDSVLEEYFDIDDISPKERVMKAKNNLKKIITFKTLNLFNSKYPFKSEEFDIVFCRNVLIYFKKDDQIAILERLFDLLRPDGTFYLGHSESLYHIANTTERLGHKIFIKRNA
ncbi:CheR family methyltransferase [Helicobacter sp. 23-1048]